MTSEHRTPDGGWQQGYYCCFCGGPSNMMGTGHGEGICDADPEYVAALKEANGNPPKFTNVKPKEYPVKKSISKPMPFPGRYEVHHYGNFSSISGFPKEEHSTKQHDKEYVEMMLPSIDKIHPPLSPEQLLKFAKEAMTSYDHGPVRQLAAAYVHIVETLTGK